jgi:hypothetical protein
LTFVLPKKKKLNISGKNYEKEKVFKNFFVDMVKNKGSNFYIKLILLMKELFLPNYTRINPFYGPEKSDKGRACIEKI